MVGSEYRGLECLENGFPLKTRHKMDVAVITLQASAPEVGAKSVMSGGCPGK